MDVAREDIFRSAPMALVQLFIATDIGREAVGALGDAGLVQFRDLNDQIQGFQRTYVKEIRRVEEALRLLRQCQQFCDIQGVKVEDPLIEGTELLSSDDIRELMATIATVESRLSQLMETRQHLARHRDKLLDKREVLQACDKFSKSGAVAASAPARDDRPLLAEDFEIDDGDEELGLEAGVALELPLIAGTIERRKYVALERLAWRVSRGNVFMANYPIANAERGAEKDAFICYSHGQQLSSRIRRVADSLDARVFDVDNSSDMRHRTLVETNAELSEVFALFDSASKTLDSELEMVAGQLAMWRYIMSKEKTLYTTLNMFLYDSTRRCLIAEGWVPREDIVELRSTLQHVTDITGIASPTVVHEIKTTKMPPTFHRTNKVTSAFQAIVDVYGVATYQEINPALPALVTFPFMFAVMFGDIGHAIILSLASYSMVLREKTLAKKRKDEIFEMAFGGRYVLLFMGLFSIYTGLMYNDVFSKSMTIFKSGWNWPKPEPDTAITATFSHAYPIGLDWGWHGAQNNLLFTNSYKMKMSILVGFTHMTYSLFFSLKNAQFFNSWVDIVGNFIPSVLFMQSIFGYLCLTIVYKWCVDWIAIEKPAPGLLNMLINMFLAPSTIDEQLYPGQGIVQKILLLTALVCVPWLLLFKPLYLKKLHSKPQFTQLSGDDAITLDENDEFTIHDEEDHHEFEFGEVMIHQVIHTIEFCLNCVSHTASYLRLWALSLAHNQLSSVLWDMTIQNAFGPTGYKGVAIVFFLFAVWFVGTVVVLVCMEGTSAMLHSLRLHWVEAMSKHFEGEGKLFTPFTFKDLEY